MVSSLSLLSNLKHLSAQQLFTLSYCIGISLSELILAPQARFHTFGFIFSILTLGAAIFWLYREYSSKNEKIAFEGVADAEAEPADEHVQVAQAEESANS